MPDLLLPAMITLGGIGAAIAAILAIVWLFRLVREWRAMSRSDWRF